MVKTITKVGNSQGIIFDSTIMDIARLKVGDAMSLTIHDSGAIIDAFAVQIVRQLRSLLRFRT